MRVFIAVLYSLFGKLIMKSYILIALAALTLNGCVSRLQQPVAIHSVAPQKKQKQTQQSVCEEVSQTSRIQQFNWLGSLQPLLKQMLEVEGIPTGSLLLVDSIKNNTSGVLQSEQATVDLHKILESNSIFSLVPEMLIKSASRSLGLSLEDSFDSRGKAIGIARIVNAQYVLYSDLSGAIQSPILDMQLILVKTGEIIWSGNSNIKY